MLGLIFYYFSSLTLALEDDKIVYREMFKSRNVFFDSILTIERGHGPFRAGVTWVLRCNDHAGPLVFNVTNFDSAGLDNFAKALLARAPNIRFSAFKLKA